MSCVRLLSRSAKIERDYGIGVNKCRQRDNNARIRGGRGGGTSPASEFGGSDGVELVSLPESLEEGMAGVVGRAVSASRAGGARLGGGGREGGCWTGGGRRAEGGRTAGGQARRGGGVAGGVSRGGVPQSQSRASSAGVGVGVRAALGRSCPGSEPGLACVSYSGSPVEPQETVM